METSERAGCHGNKPPVFLPVLHVRSLSRPPSSLQAGEKLLWIPRFNDLAAQRSMALLSPSPSLLTRFQGLRFARSQTRDRGCNAGLLTVGYATVRIDRSSLNAAAWKLEGKYRPLDFGVEFLRFDFRRSRSYKPSIDPL